MKYQMMHNDDIVAELTFDGCSLISYSVKEPLLLPVGITDIQKWWSERTISKSQLIYIQKLTNRKIEAGNYSGVLV